MVVLEVLVFSGEFVNFNIFFLVSLVGSLELFPQLFITFEQFPHHIYALHQSLRELIISRIVLVISLAVFPAKNWTWDIAFLLLRIFS